MKKMLRYVPHGFLVASILCWVLSYFWLAGVVAASRSGRLEVGWSWGAIYLFLEERSAPPEVRFYWDEYSRGPVLGATWTRLETWKRLGFDWHYAHSPRWGKQLKVGVPFAFFTLLSAAWVALAWYLRKRRARRRGFPVSNSTCSNAIEKAPS